MSDHEEWCNIYKNVGGCSCSQEAETTVSCKYHGIGHGPFFQLSADIVGCHNCNTTWSRVYPNE